MLREKFSQLNRLKGMAFFAVLFALLLFPMAAHARPITGDAVPWQDPPAITRSWRTTMLSELTLVRRAEGLDIRGNIPEIADTFNNAELINDHITEDIVNSLLAEARRVRARTITFRFEYIPTHEIISIVIYADVVSMLPHTLVRSVNFCAIGGTLLSVDEAMGVNISPLAERILSEKIRSNPEHYYAALNVPLVGQAFFLTEEKLVILFDGFRLSTRVGDVDQIEMYFSNIRTVTLSPDEYNTDGPYGLKMIPLRYVLSNHLGYTIRWESYERIVAVYRGGDRLIELREGDNEYVVLGTQRRSLEAAPMRFDTYFYVPITFFDQILPLTTFNIDREGNVTFLAYRVP